MATKTSGFLGFHSAQYGPLGFVGGLLRPLSLRKCQAGSFPHVSLYIALCKDTRLIITHLKTLVIKVTQRAT